MRVTTMTPLEIESLFQQPVEEQEDKNSPDVAVRRSQQLQEVLETAQHLWFAGDPEIDAVAQKLGDGSRDVSWRIPLGTSGILTFFLSIIAVSGLRTPLKTHTLRLIGNSCADTDANREIVVTSGYLPTIVRLIDAEHDPKLLAYVIPVLYNICVDYEPAQYAAFEAGLARRLGDLVAGPRAGEASGVLGLCAQILTFFAGKEDSTGGELLSPRLPIQLLQIPTQFLHGGLEEFVTIVSTALAFLAGQGQQKYVILHEPGFLAILLMVYERAVTTFNPAPNEDPEVVAGHKSMKNAFLTVLSDISGMDEFGPLTKTQPVLLDILLGSFFPSENPDLASLACLVLGNLARDDATAVMFASPTHNLHLRAAEMLSNPANASNAVILHAALGLLKNLAVPASNKSSLGPCLLSAPAAPLPRLWTADPLPQVQFSSVSLTRSLCTGCASNVKILLLPLSSDPYSPASQRSKLSVLLDLFARADAEPTRIECARLVLAVCRVLHSTPVVSPFWPTADEVENLLVRASKKSDRICKTVPPAPAPVSAIKEGEYDASIPPNPLPGGGFAPQTIPTPPGAPPGSNGIEDDPEIRPSARRAHFYACHAEVSKALTLLVTQEKWPALRSECWFVFALMARSAEGAWVVMMTLMEIEATNAIIEALTGRRDPHVAAVFGGGDVDVDGDGEGDGEGGGDVNMADDMTMTPSSFYSSPGKGSVRNDMMGSPETMTAAAGTPSAQTARSPSTQPGAGGTTKTQQEEQLRSLGLDNIAGLEPQQVDPKRKQNMVRVDRENAVVLMTELLRNCPDMPPFRRKAFKMLLEKAGEVVQAGIQS